MAQLRQDYQKFVDSNAEIITIGPEDANGFTKWWHEHEMPFTGIPDPTHEIAKLYNQEFKLFKGGRLPAMSVIDKEGKIRFMYYSDLPSDIPTDEDVLALLEKINKETAAGNNQPGATFGNNQENTKS